MGIYKKMEEGDKRITMLYKIIALYSRPTPRRELTSRQLMGVDFSDLPVNMISDFLKDHLGPIDHAELGRNSDTILTPRLVLKFIKDPTPEGQLFTCYLEGMVGSLVRHYYDMVPEVALIDDALLVRQVYRKVGAKEIQFPPHAFLVCPRINGLNLKDVVTRSRSLKKFQENASTLFFQMGKLAFIDLVLFIGDRLVRLQRRPAEAKPVTQSTNLGNMMAIEDSRGKYIHITAIDNMPGAISQQILEMTDNLESLIANPNWNIDVAKMVARNLSARFACDYSLVRDRFSAGLLEGFRTIQEMECPKQAEIMPTKDTRFTARLSKYLEAVYNKITHIKDLPRR
jgi:hypothetical protein